MSNAFGLNAAHPAGVADRPHVLGYATARAVAGDRVLQVQNGPDEADTVFAVDRDGNAFGGTGDILTRFVRIIPGREAIRIGSWVIEYNAATDALDFLYEPVV